MNNLKALLLAAALAASPAVTAGIITGGDTLDQAGANLLEGYLGAGDLDFTNISNLDAGATAATWHSDVQGYTNVISIYDIIFEGQSFLVGGYSSVGHDGNGYTHMTGGDNTNFIFNLTSDVVRDSGTGFSDAYDQYDRGNYFATFGGGHDLYGGASTIGANEGYSYTYQGGGYAYGGTTSLFGTTDRQTNRFQVQGLESYTFSAAQSGVQVHEPSTIAIFALGLMGLASRRFKKQS
jgi:hypothetical protein